MSYLHISQAYLDLAMLVPDCPAAVLPLFHKAARDAVLADFPEYHGIHEEVFVRITELPIEDSIRELRCALRHAAHSWPILFRRVCMGVSLIELCLHLEECLFPASMEQGHV